MTNLEKARQRLEILDRMLHGWQSAYNAGTPTMLNGEDVKDFIDDVSTQLFIGTSYLAKVTDHEFENGTEITSILRASRCRSERRLCPPSLRRRAAPRHRLL